MVSINTNAGLNSALRNLDTVTLSLEKTGDRIATGYKVIGAKDDASTFAVVQGVRADIKVFQAVDQSLAGAKGLLEVSIAAMTAMTDLNAEIKKKIIEAANPANTATQISILKADLVDMIDRAEQFQIDADYNGVNQFLTTSAPVDFVATIDGDTITVPVFGINDTRQPLETAAAAAATSADFLALIPLFDAYDVDTKQNLGSAGSVYKQVRGMQQQNKALADALTEGLGSMVDADLAKESAKYSAQQTQRQLASQSLGVATSFIQVIRGLFA